MDFGKLVGAYQNQILKDNIKPKEKNKTLNVIQD